MNFPAHQNSPSPPLRLPWYVVVQGATSEATPGWPPVTTNRKAPPADVPATPPSPLAPEQGLRVDFVFLTGLGQAFHRSVGFA